MTQPINIRRGQLPHMIQKRTCELTRGFNYGITKGHHIVFSSTTENCLRSPKTSSYNKRFGRNIRPSLRLKYRTETSNKKTCLLININLPSQQWLSAYQWASTVALPKGPTLYTVVLQENGKDQRVGSFMSGGWKGCRGDIRMDELAK